MQHWSPADRTESAFKSLLWVLSSMRAFWCRSGENSLAWHRDGAQGMFKTPCYNLKCRVVVKKHHKYQKSIQETGCPHYLMPGPFFPSMADLEFGTWHSLRTGELGSKLRKTCSPFPRCSLGCPAGYVRTRWSVLLNIISYGVQVASH